MFYLIKTHNGDVIGRLELSSDLLVEPEVAAVAAPPPPPAQEERRVMLPAAGDFSYETYRENGWSDAALVACGYMSIEMVPVNQLAVPQEDLHPSVAQIEMGEEWQAIQPAPVVAPPPPPVVESQPQVAPPPPAAGGIAPPPPPVVESQPQVAPPPPASGGAPELPEGCSWMEGPVPRIDGREFIIRDVSWERVQDSAGSLFDGRVHGVTKEHTPSTRKDGTFTKKRGVDKDYYAQVMSDQDRILRHRTEPANQAPQTPPPGAPVPPPPAAGGMAPPPPAGGMAPPPPPPPAAGGMAPPPPSGANAPTAGPQTAPPPPDNMKALDDALSDWGDEM